MGKDAGKTPSDRPALGHALMAWAPLAFVVSTFSIVGAEAVGAQEPGSGGAALSAGPQRPASTGPEEPLTPSQRFKNGKNAFEYGDCAATIDVLSVLAVPGTLQDAADQLEVHRMLGICYVLSKRDGEAAREFASLLSIDPNHSLDPFLTPPAAIELYEREKTAMATRLDELRRAREQARESGLIDEGGVLIERSTTITRVPLAASFLPFGLAQAANGETAKAVVFGSVQGALLAANVAIFWASVGILSQPRGSRLDTPEKLDTYNGLILGHLAAGAGFVAAYGVGLVDALWSREDAVEQVTTRRALSAEDVRALGGDSSPVTSAAPVR